MHRKVYGDATYTFKTMTICNRPMPHVKTAAWFKSFCLALLLSIAWSASAAALDAEQRHSKAMLQELCGRCHAVGTTGQSPNPLAPAFRTFGEKLYDTDMVQRLQDGLTTVHPDMPTFRFSRQEAAAAVNYLRSIQKSR
jgi:mono/diheme cytochrome c family protein